MKMKSVLTILSLIFLITSCDNSKERYFPEENFIKTYTENAKKWMGKSEDSMRKFVIKFGIKDEIDYNNFVNCMADTYTALTTDLDWMKKVVNEDDSLNFEDVKEKVTDLSREASKICVSEFVKKKSCEKEEIKSKLSKGIQYIPVSDGFGSTVTLTKEECGYSKPYKLRFLENGYMCTIVVESKVDNLVVLGLEVNGTFLHNFKAHKTLQRSFVVNKGQYKEFQDNTGPCNNIKSVTIHTNKGIGTLQNQ